jgi:hypothetical protein
MAMLVAFAPGGAFAQSASCTSLSIGQSQDINAFGVCKKVTLNSVPAPSAGVAGICVHTTGSAAEWASFYNNPPPGVTIASCATPCTGYLYGPYCYHPSGQSQSCDAACAGQGGCNLAGTQAVSYGGCGTLVANWFHVDGNWIQGSYEPEGCSFSQTGGGDGILWTVSNSSAVTCGAATGGRWRICACNNGGDTSGTAPCILPWGGTIAHNQSVTAYNTGASCGGCAGQTRTCNNGTLSGTYLYSSCNNSNCGTYCGTNPSCGSDGGASGPPVEVYCDYGQACRNYMQMYDCGQEMQAYTTYYCD